MTLFHGLSAFPLTPADASGRVDTDGVGRLVSRIAQAGAGSVGLLGSTGTYAYLTRAERLRAIRAATDAKAHTPLIVGVGALRTSDAIALAQDAQAAGADAVLLAPMSYTPLTQPEVFEHFRAVAAATDLPLCIYNNPTATHFQFGMPLLQRLADVPQIKAVKMPLPAGITAAEDLAQLRADLPADFVIGYSGDWGCAQTLMAGADTWYSVIGGILPVIAQNLTQAARAGDRETAQGIDAALGPLWALFQTHGSLRVVYTIAHYLRLTTAEPPRPILPLGPDVVKDICAALETLGVTPER